MHKSKILGCDYVLPEKILSNDDLSKFVETSDEWIFSRTGIKNRHIAGEHETATSLGIKVCGNLLSKLQIDPLSVDLIIVATSTADQIMPSVGVRIQGAIGCKNAFAFDVQGACAGFVYALSIADQFIQTGKVKRAIVIGSEVMSKIVDWKDRNTCVLFGDGAGAVLVEQSSDDSEIIDSSLFSDGKKEYLLHAKEHIKMKGPELYKYAVDRLGHCVEFILNKNKLEIKDIDWFVPHQANVRIIQSLSERFHIPMDKIILTLEQHANTSAASIPISLAWAQNCGKIKKGDLILFEAIGAGLVWGSILLRW